MYDELAEREQKDNVLRPVIIVFSSITDTFDELEIDLFGYQVINCVIFNHYSMLEVDFDDILRFSAKFGNIRCIQQSPCGFR